MALTSPGVEVKVIDESFYTPAEPGTTPLLVVASAENKTNGAGDGIAPGTLKANAGQVYLITSQKDLVDTFGDPVFKTDVNGNPIHAGEQNEYGLHAAYSFLGVSNRAFVVRADLDLNQLDASANEPTAEPRNGTYWLDTQTTQWGIFEWDGRPVTQGGQKFVNKVPLVITDPTKVDPATSGPTASVGKVGSYAIVTVDTNPATPALTDSHPMTIWYRNGAGSWVEVGSEDWKTSYSNITANQPKISIAPHTQVPQWKSSGNTPAVTGSVWIKTTEPNLGARWRLSRYNSATKAFSAVNAPMFQNAQTALYSLDKAGGGNNLAAGSVYVKFNYNEDTAPLANFKVFRRKAVGPTQIRTEKITQTTFTPGNQQITGQVSALSLGSVVGVTEGTYTTGALSATDTSGTGLTLTFVVAPSTLEVSVSINNRGTGFSIGDTITVPGTAIGGTSPTDNFTVTVTNIQSSTTGAYQFVIAETVAGSDALNTEVVSVSIPAPTSAILNAEALAGAINQAGLTHVTAEIDSQNRVVISHDTGGDIHLSDGVGSPLSDLGLSPFNPTTGTGTINLYADTDSHDFVASLWEPLVYVASADAPTSLTENGRLWYSSIIDEVDLMVHDGSNWVGYRNEFPDADAQGPFVQATAPETQRDTTPLVTGDIWISTDDLENFPMIYKYDADLSKWLLVDKADQSTDNGVLFADARYNTTGQNSDVAGSIESLLTEDYVDPDAPDPALYPRGMLLWNLRRSGFNVKEFRLNHIDTLSRNARVADELMTDYYPHRWVTVSANQADGSGSFGRKAQRVVVVKALQSLVGQNQQIRDEESRVFNLMACPGYPELIGELVSLNFDRGLTAFVVGDTPARLTSDATSLNAWGMNLNGAVEDNDIGAASYDEYMAMFYPWGFTSDNFGNNVVVPPSHMILRTIALNDQVAYPWFAPAGLRRGGITNATSVGYVDGQEGEFKTVALNNGQRDTLYEAKINPITFFTGTGLVNYGQKTRAKTASALDRINVARLVIYLRRQLSQLVKPYIFEPNDKVTRDEIKGACESLLVELVGQRALYDFLVVCDESNNTPNRIDRNELWIDIAIEPVKAVEFIYIPLRLKNTGEISGL
jgi:hypothetical protein